MAADRVYWSIKKTFRGESRMAGPGLANLLLGSMSVRSGHPVPSGPIHTSVGPIKMPKNLWKSVGG